MKYKTILADPPWPQKLSGKYADPKKAAKRALPYPTMPVKDICELPVSSYADDGCHLWLWTTNQFLEDGFAVMRAWGFKYLAPIHWIRPSGLGNWFVHHTQTLLFGYRSKCIFPGARYRPNVFEAAVPKLHSTKPEAAFTLIESVSPGPRLEMFARKRRDGWDAFGNQVQGSIELV